MMNERIRELAKQAGAATILFNKEGHYHIIKPELQKFAELIVRECASQAALWTPASDQGAEEQEKYILKHFGIE